MFVSPTTSSSSSFEPSYQERDCLPSTGVSPVLVYLIGPALECWGLERLVESAHPRLKLAGTAASVADSIRSLELLAPDVVVLDMEASEAEHAVEALKGATSGKPLLLTGSSDVDMLDQAVMAGLCGVVRKSDPPSLLLKAIERIHAGELWIDRVSQRSLIEMTRRKAAKANDPDDRKIATLTTRERQTIAAFVSDTSVPAKVIADRLCMSGPTLRNHLTSIYAKLEIANRLGLYAFAARHSLNELG